MGHRGSSGLFCPLFRLPSPASPCSSPTCPLGRPSQGDDLSCTLPLSSPPRYKTWTCLGVHRLWRKEQEKVPGPQSRSPCSRHQLSHGTSKKASPVMADRPGGGSWVHRPSHVVQDSGSLYTRPVQLLLRSPFVLKPRDGERFLKMVSIQALVYSAAIASVLGEGEGGSLGCVQPTWLHGSSHKTLIRKAGGDRMQPGDAMCWP